LARYQRGEGVIHVVLVPLEYRIPVCKLSLAGTRFLYELIHCSVTFFSCGPQAVKVAMGGLHDSVVFSVTTAICMSR